MKIETTALGLLKAPLRMPFKTALRTVNELEEITLQLTDHDGFVGWGSVVPTPAITGEGEERIRADLREILGWLRRTRIDEISRWKEILPNAIVYSRSSLCAVDIALHDLAAKRNALPLWKFLGSEKSRILQTNMTISVDEPYVMANHALNAVKKGFKSLKIKVGLDAELDKKRVRCIRQVIGKGISLRLDANQGWTEAESRKLIPWFAQECGPIDFIEQPVQANDLSAMQKITQSSPVPIVADESAMTLEQAKRVIEVGAAHALSVKLIKAGGLSDARAILDLARKNEIPCLMSCMFECGAGLHAAVHLASVHPAVRWVDLDAAEFLLKLPYVGGVQFGGATIECGHGNGLEIDLTSTLFDAWN